MLTRTTNARERKAYGSTGAEGSRCPSWRYWQFLLRSDRTGGGRRRDGSALRSGALLLLDGDALTAEGRRWAAALAPRKPALLAIATFPARVEQGPQLPSLALRLPYFPEDVRRALAGVHTIIRVGAEAPVSFSPTRACPAISPPRGAREADPCRAP